MAERGPGRIIRPMLHVTREEVLAYLKSIDGKFVNDSSNQSSAMLRNRVRAELMPMLERDYAPGLRGRLFDLATELRALDDFVGAAARRELQSRASNDGLDISSFDLMLPALQAEVIRQYLKMRRPELCADRAVAYRGHPAIVPRWPANGSLDFARPATGREYGLLRVATEVRRAGSIHG